MSVTIDPICALRACDAAYKSSNKHNYFIIAFRFWDKYKTKKLQVVFKVHKMARNTAWNATQCRKLPFWRLLPNFKFRLSSWSENVQNAVDGKKDNFHYHTVAFEKCQMWVVWQHKCTLAITFKTEMCVCIIVQHYVYSMHKTLFYHKSGSRKIQN